MTARQQRRLEQKLARRAAKRAHHQREVGPPVSCPSQTTRSQDSGTGPLLPQEPGDSSTTSISEAKLLANRANAQLSTGAISEAGKAIVSQNATKHGLTSKFNKRTDRSVDARKFKVLPCESQAEFDQLLAGFLRSEAPMGEDEREMVHQMAEALWLSRRCLRLQNDCFAGLESGTPEQHLAVQKSLALYMRYQTAHDRTFVRYSTEMRKRRNERARAERGFVSQKSKEAAESRRQELHAVRQAHQNLRQEAQKIRNRLAAAKAEALELKNLARKSTLAPQTPEMVFAAAA